MAKVTPSRKNGNEGVDLLKRMDEYEQEHCWQYDIRLNNSLTDIAECGLTPEETEGLKTSDFDFRIVENKAERFELTQFIRKHEWLGNLSQFTTHWFGAYYNGVLAGVILMNMPNAFSKILGEDTRKIERLVSRGACISWSPKNLASNFLMWCVKYMVQNTDYRLFSAYSDPTAKELGTIYQACNWSYLGQDSGATKRYINPYNGRLMSDRTFRVRSFYKKYAQELDIPWQPEWNSDNKIHWDKIPDDVEVQLREMSKSKQKASKHYVFPAKHKYVYTLGRSKKETRELKKRLTTFNKLKPYPKERGN